MTQVLFKATAEEIAKWKQFAASEGLTFSAWIRNRCNGEVPMKVEAMKAAVTHPENPGQKYYHMAASNRLTCLCASCVAYRENNAIPAGGFAK